VDDRMFPVTIQGLDAAIGALRAKSVTPGITEGTHNSA